MRYKSQFISSVPFKIPRNSFSISSLKKVGKQDLRLGDERISAFYNSKKDETRIIVGEEENEETYTEEGLMLINLLTDNAELKYSFG